MRGCCFGRYVGILGMTVWNKGALCPTFLEMDVVVIMPLGLGAKELAEEAVEGAELQGFCGWL